MNILDTLQSELKQASCIQKIVIEYVSALPDESETGVAVGKDSVDADAEEKPYWVDWSEQLGAWVSQNGSYVRVLITEDAREIDPGVLFLGFTSTLTGICLNLQGQIAIHANAVMINGKAVAFIGYSGAGKSTLSAFCASSGAAFITDDVLVVDDQGYVQPGNPRIKLYPSTGSSLGLDTSEETDYKIFFHPEHHLGGSYQQQPIPLGRLYLLTEAEKDEIYVESVPPAQAVFDLITHGYEVSSFISRNPRLFDAYVQIVSRLPVQRLVYPHDFDRLPEVYNLLLQESQKQ